MGVNYKQHFSYQDKSMTFADWAKLLGVKQSTLEQRFFCYKWSVEKTLSTPIGRYSIGRRN